MVITKIPPKEFNKAEYEYYKARVTSLSNKYDSLLKDLVLMKAGLIALLNEIESLEVVLKKKSDSLGVAPRELQK